MPLEIACRQQEGIKILTLKGRLVLGEEDLLLRKEIDEAACRKTCLVLDISAVTTIDSTGLGTLVYADQVLKKAADCALPT
jgi:anti-anti-sigma factor